MATNANLYVDAGADYFNTITVLDDTGIPLDLSSYTVKSQIRKSYGSTTAYNFNAEVYDAIDGLIRIHLSATQSEAILAGRYLYDIEITQTESGIKTRVIEGLVIVNPQITQI